MNPVVVIATMLGVVLVALVLLLVINRAEARFCSKYL